MKAILSILVALGIPAAFWNYYLRESPDVQYSLSAAIPLGFQDSAKESMDQRTSDEFVQQIEIANSGKGEAKKIVVKIPKAIGQFHLAKHSTSEQVGIFQAPGAFELDYPSLPPASGFQITLKVSGAPITESQLEVSHQAGRAKIVSPVSRSGDISIWTLLWILLPIFYAWSSYSNMRNQFKFDYLFKRYSQNVGELLRNEKPWYIRQSDWPEVVEDLLKRALAEPQNEYGAISSCTPFRILESDKPDALSQGAWESLRKTSSEKLLGLAISKANLCRTRAEILDLLNGEWPSGLSEAAKVKLIGEISSIYTDNIVRSWSVNELATLLVEDKKPAKVSEAAWNRLKEVAASEIAKDLAIRLMDQEAIPLDDSPAWGLLSYRDKEKLKKLAMIRTAATDAEERLKEYQAINEATRKDIQTLREEKNREISALRQENGSLKSREFTVAANEEKNLALLDKVRRQLDVIERVIADPAYLERIEPEDNTFASGNWLLLRQLTQKSVT